MVKYKYTLISKEGGQMNIFDSIGLLDKNKLLKIFDYLNERLKENQLNLEITI